MNERAAGAWSAGEVVSWVMTNLVGLVVIVAALVLARGRDHDLAAQVLPLNLAVGGLVVGGAGNLVLLLSGWRRLNERSGRLLDADVDAVVIGRPR